MDRPLVATIGFEYELHRIYGRHLEGVGFRVVHHHDVFSLKRSVSPAELRGLVVSLDAIRNSHIEAVRLVHTWPAAVIVTAGRHLGPDAAQKMLGAGIAGHVDWATEQPRSVAALLGQLCGIL